MKSIEERIKNLPPALKKEVEEFVNSLLKKRRKRSGKKLRQDWAGALKDYRDQYTSSRVAEKSLGMAW